MSFEYSEYYSGFVGLTLFLVIVASTVILFSIILYIFYDKFKHIVKLKAVKKKPYETIVACMFLLGAGLIEMNYNFLLDDKNTFYQIEGVISDVSEIERPPKFSYEGTRVNPVYITIDDEKYYLMYIGDFEIGDEVKLEYLPKSKVVLTIEFIPTDLE